MHLLLLTQQFMLWAMCKIKLSPCFMNTTQWRYRGVWKYTTHSSTHSWRRNETDVSVCFLAQLCYPAYRLNSSRTGQPWKLSGYYEDERELFLCQKLMDNSLVIQPTAQPSCTTSSCPTGTEASHITYSMDGQLQSKQGPYNLLTGLTATLL